MNVTLKISTTQQSFPAGTVGGLYRYAIPAASMAADSADLQMVFNDVPPGDYTATAQRLDASGNPLGTAVSATFTVPAPSLVDVPSAITVELAP